MRVDQELTAFLQLDPAIGAGELRRCSVKKWAAFAN